MKAQLLELGCFYFLAGVDRELNVAATATQHGDHLLSALQCHNRILRIVKSPDGNIPERAYLRGVAVTGDGRNRGKSVRVLDGQAPCSTAPAADPCQINTTGIHGVK